MNPRPTTDRTMIGFSCLRASLNEDYFFTEPKEIFSYSNPGFDVAGFLIEEVGGRPYADQMSERLFKPLGMNRIQPSARLWRRPTRSPRATVFPEKLPEFKYTVPKSRTA